MQVEALLPRVADEFDGYCGFKAGDVINDHDVALGYVLDHFPDVLPSFSLLKTRPADARPTFRSPLLDSAWCAICGYES